MASKQLPVGRKIAGVRHAAATDVAGCKWPSPLPPCLSRHLPCPLGDTGLFGTSGFKGRGIGGGRRLTGNGPFLRGVDSCSLQGRLGAVRRCAIRGGTDERGSGGLYYPRRGGLNRWSRTGRGARTKLGSSETYSRELAACVQNRINMRYHALQYHLETIHHLI